VPPTGEIEKQLFRNEDGGYVGAVVIGPRGDDRGVAVAPGETVWLSEAEQRLTAHAPRRPEDSPFVAQKRVRTDPETGEVEEYEVTPLVAVEDERYVPADLRIVPGVRTGHQSSALASQAAKAEEPSVPVAMDANALTRHAELEDDPDAQPRPTPRVPARAAAAARVEQTDLPGPMAAPQPPQETPEQRAENEAKIEAQPTPPDETAARVDQAVGEETGAATPPQGEPPQGEYAAREEVGTPVPPQEEEQEKPQPGPPQNPPPYSPGSSG
jgi:hypothetical protein